MSAVDYAQTIRRELGRLQHHDAASVRAIQRKYALVFKSSSADDVIRVVRSLMERGGWPDHVVAWESLAKHREAFARVDDALVEEMADRWRRRLALVATVPLNAHGRGGKGDPRRTLKICRVLLDGRDDMVVKAMSWALRELAKRNPREVRNFIEQENERLAPRVKREVSNKLKPNLKNPRRSGGRK